MIDLFEFSRDRRRRAHGERIALLMCMQRHEGFSLIETLVALTVLLIGVSAMARLFVLALHATHLARAMTTASILAEAKMEQLRVRTDLSSSPADALTRRTASYCDLADEAGHNFPCDSDPPPKVWYERRWSIEPLRSDPDTIVLQVVVAQQGFTLSAVGRAPGMARLVSVKTRKAGM